MSYYQEQTSAASVDSNTSLARPGSPAGKRVRIFFLDNLRVALTVLVVLHHLAVIYGATTAFYYVEPPGPQDRLASLVFLVFVLFNQAYFMGFFFLISGYFTPGSFERKTPGTFYKDRLVRLGIPTLAYVFVLSPLASISPLLSPTPGNFFHLTPLASWQQFPEALGVGPLWFAEMLLIFDLGYIIWRWLIRGRVQIGERTSRPPTYLAVGLFILGLALANYMMCIVVPMGMFIPILGFPTLSFLPQYLSFFVLGAIAFRQNWFLTIPGSMGKIGFVAAGLATLVLFPLALSGGTAFLGHGTWQSAVYALWDSTFSVGICLGAITLFRRFFNRQNRFDRMLSQQSFTVYIIHIPIIVLFALALRGFHAEALLKFALAALVGVPLCYALASLVRKIPFASKIL
ncbi:acyltransferase family protein [Ktedonosporobacter rubrisoli]|nr:acyltransferase family protein [Ktedonosporobacter rubrisoli]